ncbi:MAG: FHA domain-containing protein, partial [Polyangia bacterium]
MANVVVPVKFQIFRGDQVVREEVLTEPVIKIGKLASSHLRLDDESVSRMHAVLEVNGPNEVQLIDLGSTRGTLVNGERVAKASLKSGDQVQFGDVRVAITFAAADAEAPTPGPVMPVAPVAPAPVAPAQYSAPVRPQAPAPTLVGYGAPAP